MNKYEIMFIVRPNLEEDAIKNVASDLQKTIEKNKGKIVEVKEMGQKELAYEINKFKTGYYYLFTIETEAAAIEEINRVANVSEDIIRHLIVKIED